MFFDPANGPRSISATRFPERAKTIAAQEPAGPAPTTMASKSVLMLHQRFCQVVVLVLQLQHLHHKQSQDLTFASSGNADRYSH
jgi:hypothetical protein